MTYHIDELIKDVESGNETIINAIINNPKATLHSPTPAEADAEEKGKENNEKNSDNVKGKFPLKVIWIPYQGAQGEGRGG